MSVPISSSFNDAIVAQTYDSYRQDPGSVDESWRQFFRFAEQLGGAGPSAAPAMAVPVSALRVAAGASALVAAIRLYGHLAVHIDPLGSAPHGAAELHPEFHGVTEEELRSIPATAFGDDEEGTAADYVDRLRRAYCGSLGYELEHLSDEAEREWFRRVIESGEASPPLTPDQKMGLLELLTAVDGLERFVGRAYVSMKRFSIEGVDALVPLLVEAIARGAQDGAHRVVIGMAHRGRLNVLVHVMGKSYRALFEDFEGHYPDISAVGETGDVKYHMGYRATRAIPGAGSIEIDLVPNPSHLEFVNPVAMGVVRALQRVPGGAPGQRDELSVLPIVVHGDASFAGEGIVAETLNLELLRGYRVGGSLHIMVNNQVGFTTDPVDARSTHYASDLAKGFEIPIVHVNGDDAEACLMALRLGMTYRKRFGHDFLIDLVGYRRHGHNEADQPAFTQPAITRAIAAHPTPRQLFGARLVREGVLGQEQMEAVEAKLMATLQSTYEAMKRDGPPRQEAADERSGPGASVPVETAVRAERLVSLNEQLLTWPTTLALHATIQRTMPRRREALHTAIDWGHAEALAFASLLADGIGVRLTGQDAERGTFSHRHAVLHDQVTGQTYTPLANLPQARAPFEVYNSPLSETAVLAFEYGFSTATPGEMVLWEAQFGDFANVAQPVIDQFIAADYAKWARDSGLVLLLPHGYEGQGPEHSSARFERFLQLFAEGNITVAYLSTPAQYFHVLRRQALRPGRRPLVLMQPKSLLRLPRAASRLDEFTTGAFQRVIDDPVASESREQVQRLVFCTGKVYYDLSEQERPATVAIARVEELAPWPREVGDVMDLYPNVEEVVWAQEEPKNMGAWTYVQPRLRASIGTIPFLRYIGRPERASPAEGSKRAHDVEQERIVNAVKSYVSAVRKKATAR